jgi:hypothetical protein
MKRSKKIQLVLITAALASCNRHIVPSQSSANIDVDSILIAPPAYSESVDCNCGQLDSSAKNYLFNPLSINYFNRLNNIYYPGKLYRKGAFWRNDHFIVRGGFGKNAGSAAS